MTRRIAALITALALAAAGLAAGAARADHASCVADAQASVASASVEYVGDSWGPTPLYRVHLPNGNTVDVNANSADEARSTVSSWAAGNCPADAPAAPAADTSSGGATTGSTSGASSGTTTSSGTTSTDYTAQASSMVAGDPSLVGNSWGPLPLWRVALTNGGTVDVNAADAAAARDVVVSWLAGQLAASGGSSSSVQAPAAPLAADGTTTTSATDAASATDTAAPTTTVATADTTSTSTTAAVAPLRIGDELVFESIAGGRGGV